MTHITVAIMAHPARAAFIPELVERLDVFPDAIVWDRSNDRWDTGKRSMLAADPAADYHMVIQDDTIPAPDLIAGVRNALAHVPAGSPLMLYVGNVRPFAREIDRQTAGIDGPAFLSFRETYWGPALVYPTAQIPDIVRWCDRGRIPNYDRRVGLWYARERIPVWATWPSLVEHRPDTPSLVAGRNADRQARRFIGADVSAASIEWPDRVVRIMTTTTPPRR